LLNHFLKRTDKTNRFNIGCRHIGIKVELWA
jgi:hypothetical protein